MSESGAAGSRGSWERVKEGPGLDVQGGGYTPTTEKVRDAYTRALRDAFIASAGEHDAEFDSWLLSERARIWDEGWRAYFTRRNLDDNPYRKGGNA